MPPARSLPPLVAAALVAGCATAPPATPSVQGEWRVLQARSEPLLDTRRARLELNADGTLTGHTSCNAMRSRFTQEGDAFRVAPIVTTKMACGPLYLEQEDRILSALEVAATARVRPDGLLEIRDAGGRGVLRAKKWENE